MAATFHPLIFCPGFTVTNRPLGIRNIARLVAAEPNTPISNMRLLCRPVFSVASFWMFIGDAPGLATDVPRALSGDIAAI